MCLAVVHAGMVMAHKRGGGGPPRRSRIRLVLSVSHVFRLHPANTAAQHGCCSMVHDITSEPRKRARAVAAGRRGHALVHGLWVRQRRDGDVPRGAADPRGRWGRRGGPHRAPPLAGVHRAQSQRGRGMGAPFPRAALLLPVCREARGCAGAPLHAVDPSVLLRQRRLPVPFPQQAPLPVGVPRNRGCRSGGLHGGVPDGEGCQALCSLRPCSRRGGRTARKAAMIPSGPHESPPAPLLV
mmetsp:Transcript_7297/g.17544  ORF Transcript_7297/g.17544 Transcript_7297/m.17544 type:complete len:240 (+) Transcript_7297:279-998(+)